MVLSEIEIKDRKIIKGYIDTNFRKAGYDIRVNEIFVPKETSSFNRVHSRESIGRSSATLKEHFLPPQGMCILYSKEYVSIPYNVIGLVTPKTSASDIGLMVLNTGLIDPGYNGYLSVIAMNFSSEKIRLHEGFVFLRTIFLNISSPVAIYRDSGPANYSTYKITKEHNFKELPRTFLDVDTLTQYMLKESSKKNFNTALKFLSIAMAALAVIQVFLPIVIKVIDKKLLPLLE